MMNVTKFVHLNGGDDAAAALLQRAHELLRPGGHLLLVAQRWESYAKHRHLVHGFAGAMARMRLRPGDFLRFLLDEVGFARVRAAVTARKPASAGTTQLLVLQK